MKTIYTSILAVCLLSFYSCSENGDGTDSCGEEKVTAMTISSYSNLDDYPTTAGFATYSTVTAYLGSRTYFGIVTEATGVCTGEAVLISTTFVMDTANTAYTDSVFVVENGVRTILPSTLSGTVFNDDNYYTPNGTGGSTTLQINHYVSFPSQGSGAADSAYFFGNLDQLFMGMTLKEAK